MRQVHLVQHAEKELLPGDPGLTLIGVKQAERVADHLVGLSIGAIYSSPLQRALETSEIIGERLGLVVLVDGRLAEKVNWDGTVSYEEFVEEWDRAVKDRDYQPFGAYSSHQNAERVLEFVGAVAVDDHDVVAVTHGGAMVDVLRTLVGDDDIPRDLLRQGPAPTAITTLNGQYVVAMSVPPPWE